MRDFQAPGRSVTFGTEAMCATSHPLGAQGNFTGLQVFEGFESGLFVGE